MPLKIFVQLEIPVSKIPPSLRDSFGRILLSTKTISLVDQALNYGTIGLHVDESLRSVDLSPDSYLRFIRNSGCMQQGMLPETNLGNLIALGVVAQGILDNRGLKFTDAVCVFLEVKVDYLRRFQDALGEEEVYFPDALKNIDFGDADLKANTWRYLKDKGVNVGTWCDFIRDNLSVICLSTNSLQPRSFDGMRGELLEASH